MFSSFALYFSHFIHDHRLSQAVTNGFPFPHTMLHLLLPLAIAMFLLSYAYGFFNYRHLLSRSRVFISLGLVISLIIAILFATLLPTAWRILVVYFILYGVTFLMTKRADEIMLDQMPHAHFRKILIILMVITLISDISGFYTHVTYWSAHINFSIGKHSFSLLSLFNTVYWFIFYLLIFYGLSQIAKLKINHASLIDAQGKMVSYNLVKLLLLILCIILILPLLGINLTTFTVLGGALAAGIGLGLQNILNNYICGLIIMLDRSLRINQLVTLDQFTGYITQINTRFVKLTSFSGEEALIPNIKMITNIVVNSTKAILHNVRQEFFLVITHESNLQKAIQIIKGAVQSQACYTNQSETVITVHEITTQGIRIRCVYWILNPPSSAAEIHSKVLLKIKSDFECAGIRFAKSTF